MERPGGATQPDRGPEYARAAVAAYALVEDVQTGPVGQQVRALREAAEAAGWHDLVCLAHYADYVRRLLAGGDTASALDATTDAAERSGDEALVALALAASSELAPRDGATSADRDADLARAVALLDAGGGSAVHRPTAWVACAAAYHLRSLWELEEEMYARADTALAVPLPPGLRPTGTFTRRAVLANRLEVHAAWAAALLEAGLHDEARTVAATRVRPTPERVSDLPPRWVLDLAGVDYLLAAVAGEERPASLDEALRDVEGSAWPGYAGCVLLGEAVRLTDEGRAAAGAAAAERALETLTSDYLPTLRMLALDLASRPGADAAVSRYLGTLTSLRWEARLQLLGSARARLDSERIRLESERLAEQAFLDELTGVANRHAYTRHLGRLRRSRGSHDVAVFMVDVDRFKAVNDRFGHHVGDHVLRRVARLLAERSRPTDLVARLGGDEFVLVLDAVHCPDAVRRGHELVRAVGSEPWGEVDAGLGVSVSAGLACGPAAGVDALLAEADRLLYRAKSNGRARLETDLV